MQNIIQNPSFIHDKFQHWFQEACEKEISNPNAMALSTATVNAIPSVRMVLMKHFDENLNVHFFTNYESRKGDELNTNPKAALLFYWKSLDRQIRIEGDINKLSREDSDEYYQSRPRMSRIGVWASQQSRELESMELLRDKVDEFDKKYHDDDVPCPDYWGGYCLTPYYFEFWQDRRSRLHEREIYQLHDNKNNWQFKRLYP